MSMHGKKELTSLLELIPSCEGHELMNNVNEVFGLIDENVSSIMNSMVYFITKKHRNDAAMTPADLELLRKMLSNIRQIIDLCEIQKRKLCILQHKERRFSLDMEEIMLENKLLKSMYPRKRRLPSTPVDSVSKKRTTLDTYIAGVHQSVYRAVLTYPSPVFAFSDFVESTQKKLNFFETKHLEAVLPLLKDQGLINYVEMPVKNEWVIIKELRCPLLRPDVLSRFGLKKEEYIAESLTPSLAHFTLLVSRLNEVAVRIIDEHALPMLATILIATILIDETPVLYSNSLPTQLRRAVKEAKNALFREDFLKARREQPGIYDKKPLGDGTISLETRYLSRFSSFTFQQ